LDFDINPENLIKDKKRFFSVTFFIKQKREKLTNLNNIKNIISSNFGSLFKELECELIENEFEVSKTK
jgi:site-specific DNA-cytosine methylase